MARLFIDAAVVSPSATFRAVRSTGGRTPPLREKSRADTFVYRAGARAPQRGG